MAKQTFKDAKFRELVLFISERSQGDTAFGITKLNKLLFFSDFIAYRAFGESITGARYQKLDWGPAPRPLVPMLERLEQQGDITTVKTNYFGRVQDRVVPKRPPVLDRFSAREIDLVAQIIDGLWGSNANEVSGIAHKFVGWRAANMHEDIPYETILIANRPEVTESIRRRGVELEPLAKRFLAREE